MGKLTAKQYRRDEAYRKVSKLKSFYMHVGAYLSINIILFIIWKTEIFNAAVQFWENTFFVTLVLGGLGLLSHWAGIFGYKLLLPKDWEQKKIEKLKNSKENK